jgi:hypothetical protein
MSIIQYKVKPVTRYIVTRYEASGDEQFGKVGTETCGEFDNYRKANSVCQALAKAELLPEQGEGVHLIQYRLFSPECDIEELTWVTVEGEL